MDLMSADEPRPRGQLYVQRPVTTADADPQGRVSGGWLLAQMDQAAELAAGRRAQGRTATLAVDQLVFLRPLHRGQLVALYVDLDEVGRSSLKMTVEAWVLDGAHPVKLGEGRFTLVALGEDGRTRALP